MERVRVGQVELYAELLGPQDAPLFLLIHGLGGQLIDWDDGFCDLLLAGGFRVLRYDQRDSGLSTIFDGAGRFDLDAVARRDRSALAYGLEDMADDAAGLLDALGVDVAHVAGRSMGGMVAQSLAIRHPDRVRSLCSIMSTTGDHHVGAPTEAATAVLLRPVARSRQDVLDGALASYRVLGSPGFPLPEEAVLARAAAQYDRSFQPGGTARQLMAILLAEDRTPALRRLQVPTLVVHGEDDALVTVSGGRATAEAIPGARLLIIPGLGHETPPAVWPEVSTAMLDHARAAEAAGTAQAAGPGTGGAS